MKFSADTLNALKNFSQINPSVLFRPGSKIRTISPQKTVMAVADVEEEFDTTAGVYDLSRLLATLSLFEDPNIVFEDNQFHIFDEKSSVKYTYTAENMIVSPPNQDIEVPDIIAEFDVEWTYLKRVRDAAGVLGLPEISFASTGEGVIMSAVQSSNPTADNYSIVLDGDKSFPEFSMIIKSEYLKLLERDYCVRLSSKGMAHFSGGSAQYWIAIESQ